MPLSLFLQYSYLNRHLKKIADINSMIAFLFFFFVFEEIFVHTAICVTYSGRVYQRPFGCASRVLDNTRACVNVVFDEFNALLMKFYKKLL